MMLYYNDQVFFENNSYLCEMFGKKPATNHYLNYTFNTLPKKIQGNEH